jgi:hypothetical protein
MRKRRLGKLLRRTLGQVLFGDAAELATQKALPQLGAAAGGGRRTRDALDQREAGGGDSTK